MLPWVTSFMEPRICNTDWSSCSIFSVTCSIPWLIRPASCRVLLSIWVDLSFSAFRLASLPLFSLFKYTVVITQNKAIRIMLVVRISTSAIWSGAYPTVSALYTTSNMFIRQSVPQYRTLKRTSEYRSRTTNMGTAYTKLVTLLAVKMVNTYNMP